MPLEQMIRFCDIPQMDGRMDHTSMKASRLPSAPSITRTDSYEDLQYAKEITDASGGKIYAAFSCPGKQDVVKRQSRENRR